MIIEYNLSSCSIRRLFLNDNQISDIGRGTFGAITRIGTINLARNVIPKVDYQMFAQLNYIEVLNEDLNILWINLNIHQKRIGS